MKRWLPIKLKQGLWWIFKSPQRQWVGWSTLLTDFRGYLAYQLKSGELQPISICIGIKNRSEHLLNHVLPSLNACENGNLIHLSVYDAGSSDNENLEEAIRQVWKGALIYHCQEQNFTRSKTFNAAILQAPTELVMACDADISLPKVIVQKINRYVTKRTSWFPQVWWLSDDKTSGRFFTEGTGLFASTKTNFIKAGGYDESITEWGKEDWLLFFAFYKHGIACIRTNEKDMIHWPHVSLKPEGFEKLF